MTRRFKASKLEVGLAGFQEIKYIYDKESANTKTEGLSHFYSRRQVLEEYPSNVVEEGTDTSYQFEIEVPSEERLRSGSFCQMQDRAKV